MGDDSAIRVGAFVGPKGSWGVGLKIPLDGEPILKKKIEIVPYREVDPTKTFTKEELASEALSALLKSIKFRK